jgi:ACR3 family arsenite efflux pump ArsB
MTDVALHRQTLPELGTVERYLSLWVALCILAGIVLGSSCRLRSTLWAEPRWPRSTCR